MNSTFRWISASRHAGVMVSLAVVLGACALVPQASASSPGHNGLIARSGRLSIAARFVSAANRGDYAAVCRLYSRSYLKVSRNECVEFYRWGELFYGPYDYKIVSRRRLSNGRWRISLTHWFDRSPSFIEIARGKIVAGGW